MNAPAKTCSRCGGELHELLDGYDACRHCGVKLNPGRRLAETLDDVVKILREYVIFPSPHEARAIALWIVMTWVIDAFDVVMYLHHFSPEPESGKTRALEIESKLVRAPWLVSRPTAPTLFRMIEERQPVLLWDEIDRVFAGKIVDANTADLQAVVNSGHKRGAVVPRCVGEGKNLKVKDFSVFTPMAFAGINQMRLPDTVRSRSIPISLRRRAADEPVRRWREREVDELVRPVVAELASLAMLHVGPLRDARPKIPDGLGDRAVDGWEPLCAIAEAAGGEWPKRAREAAVALNGIGRELDATTVGIQLLADIESIFTTRGADRISSEDLVLALHGVEESDWVWITKSTLARKLRGFGIRPTKVRLGDRVLQGYHLDLFLDAFRRYLHLAGTNGTNGTPQVATTSDVPDVPDVPATRGEEEPVELDVGVDDIAVPTADDIQRLAAALGFPRLDWRGYHMKGRKSWAWTCKVLDHSVPENRTEVYAALEAIEGKPHDGEVA